MLKIWIFFNNFKKCIWRRIRCKVSCCCHLPTLPWHPNVWLAGFRPQSVGPDVLRLQCSCSHTCTHCLGWPTCSQWHTLAHTFTHLHTLPWCLCLCSHTALVANQHSPVRSPPQPQQHLAGIAGIAHCTNSPNLACTGGRQWKTHITSDENSRTQCLVQVRHKWYSLNITTTPKDAACTIPIDWSCFAAELRLTYQACESQESADSIQCFSYTCNSAAPVPDGCQNCNFVVSQNPITKLRSFPCSCPKMIDV